MHLQVLRWFSITNNTYLFYSQTPLYGHLLNMDTLYGPSVSELMGFDGILFIINAVCLLYFAACFPFAFFITKLVYNLFAFVFY